MSVAPPIGPWLHREGNWVLLETHRCGPSMWGYNHSSLIWHECRLAGRPPLDNWKGMWRIGARNLDTPCPVCNEVCPPEIQALWRFHNWETMDSDYTYTSFYNFIP